MKKLLALALSAVMALSLVACGGGGSDKGGDAELLPVQPETVKILAQSTREAEPMEASLPWIGSSVDITALFCVKTIGLVSLRDSSLYLYSHHSGPEDL